MNKIPLPNNDNDIDYLLTILQGRSISYSSSKIHQILNSYIAYTTNQGDPHSIAPIPNFSEDEKKDLYKLYNTGIVEIKTHIDNLRDNHFFKSCPACGGRSPTTLDHILPRKIYPELSILTHNLIPACSKCNNDKRTNHKGSNIGERILHPYFDDFMKQRLVYIQILPGLTGYDRPKFRMTLIDPNHPHLMAIKYHLEKVILCNPFFKKEISTSWKNIITKPKETIRFRGATITRGDVDTEVEAFLTSMDSYFGSKNNWESMLIYGIHSNPAVKDFIYTIL